METVTLVAYVNACCPQQAMDEFTPDVWHDLLGHLDLADCRAAVIALGRRQPFIAPSEIIREIADRRSARQPHSNACREGSCRDCRVSWCLCACHPAAVEALTRPSPPSGTPLARGGEPAKLGAGDFTTITRTP